jgi:hypothetical protein
LQVSSTGKVAVADLFSFGKNQGAASINLFMAAGQE